MAILLEIFLKFLLHLTFVIGIANDILVGVKGPIYGRQYRPVRVIAHTRPLRRQIEAHRT